jgi:CheY-like chemotaxis protein
MESGESEGVLDLLHEAEESLMRAGNITQQLLAFAAGSGPQIEIVRAEASIEEAISLTLAGSAWPCKVTCAPDVWRVKADPRQLTQVVRNLLINARQAMPDGGQVHVTVENLLVTQGGHLPLVPGQYVRIRVQDEGAGIQPECLDRLFDPFYTTRDGASGLGLTAAFSIVRSHAGALTVTSTPGQGSEFVVYLPAQTEAVLTQAPLPEKPSESHPWRILVLDDERSIRKLLKMYLEGVGHAVTTTVVGAEAIEAWERAIDEGAPFDLAILDLTLPGALGGKDVVVDLKRLTPQAHMIASSGYATDPIMTQFRAYGFCARLAKPYRLKEVLTLIEELQSSAHTCGP